MNFCLKNPLSIISINCHDLCWLLHFGSPPVKLEAPYCLLEFFTRLSEQRNIKHEELPNVYDHCVRDGNVFGGSIFIINVLHILFGNGFKRGICLFTFFEKRTLLESSKNQSISFHFHTSVKNAHSSPCL